MKEPDASSRNDSRRSRGPLGWFLDRSGALVALDETRKFGGKLIPTLLPSNLSWLYTTGALALFFVGLQFFTGCLLLVLYVPDESLAYRSIQTIEHEAHLGWLVRQTHSWGASFIMVVLILHVFKLLWFGSYKRPREFTWFVGAVLFFLILAFCFSGYLLPWNQLSFWATRVAIEAVDSIPVIGPRLKELICGGPEVSGRTIGRFFSLHVVVLPALLVALVLYHLALITYKGMAPKTTVREEFELGNTQALRRHGAETFFPRQVYRDLFVCNLGLALLVTVATFWPWKIGEPAALETPLGIRPEWYFLPMYQFLKYFDDKFLGLLIMGGAAGVFFLLPLLDWGKQRRIRRRPFFATVAFLALVGVLSLGVLGYLSERELTVFGTTLRFDIKGVPSVVERAAKEGSAGKAGADERSEKDAGAGSPAERDGDGEARGADERGVADGGGRAGARADAKAEPPDGALPRGALPPGGTCAGCHESQSAEWRGSVHFANQVKCVHCHGGIDTAPPAFMPAALARAPDEEIDECDVLEELEPEEWGLYAYAHLGVSRTGKGCPSAPSRKEIPDFCASSCHQDVRRQFSERHLAESPKKSCVNCHSNHSVRKAGDATYEKGYAGEGAKAESFRKIREAFESLDGDLVAARAQLDNLRKVAYPIGEFEGALGNLEDRAAGLRPLVHSLEPETVRGRAESVAKDLGELRGDIDEALRARDDRWLFVAGIWAVAVFFCAVLGWKLRALRAVEAGFGAPPPAAVPEAAVGGVGSPAPPPVAAVVAEEASAAAVAAAEAEELARAGDERGALLHPLAVSEELREGSDEPEGGEEPADEGASDDEQRREADDSAEDSGERSA